MLYLQLLIYERETSFTLKIHHLSYLSFRSSPIVKRCDSYSKTETKELKDMGLRLSCHRDVKYSTAPLTIAGGPFLWTHSVVELLYRNEFYSTIVRTSEQENPYRLSLKTFNRTVVACSHKYFYNLLSNLFFMEELSLIPLGSYFKSS